MSFCASFLVTNFIIQVDNNSFIELKEIDIKDLIEKIIINSF